MSHVHAFLSEETTNEILQNICAVDAQIYVVTFISLLARHYHEFNDAIYTRD